MHPKTKSGSFGHWPRRFDISTLRFGTTNSLSPSVTPYVKQLE